MKNKTHVVKRVLACIMVVVMAVTSVPLSGFVGLELPKWSEIFSTKASAATEYKSGYYTYTVSDGKATITDVDDSISGNITVPSTLGGYPVVKIGDWAFSYNRNLTSVAMTNSVTTIGESAFLDCANVSKVVIPSSVTEIESWAFKGCNKMTGVSIPNSVKSIGRFAFGLCEKLTSISVDNSNLYYSSVGGVLLNKQKTTLIQYPTGNPQKSYTIPNGVTDINSSAFASCGNLSSITIPSSMNKIWSYAFEYFNNIKTVNFNGSRSRWAEINIEDGNMDLLNADINFTDNGSNLKLTAEQAVNVFMWYEDVWEEKEKIEEYWNYPYYGFLDLDFDGVLELVRTVNQGSGYYEYTSFYRIDPADMKIKSIEYYDDGYYSEFAIDRIFGSSDQFKVVQNKVTGKKMYFGCDWQKESIQNGGRFFGVLYDKNGKVYDHELFGEYTDYYEAYTDEIYYCIYDNNHNFQKVTKQKYDETVKEFWKNHTDLNVKCSSVAAETYHKATTKEKRRQYLLDSYYTFNYDGYEGNNNVTEHLNFIKNDSQYINQIKKANFAGDMVSYKDTFQYQWFKLIDFDFKNYYDVVLADLLLMETTKDKINEISLNYVGKEQIEIIKTFVDGIKSLVDQDEKYSSKLPKNLIEKIVKGEADTNSESYKLLSSFFKNNVDAQNKLKALADGAEKTKSVTKLLKTGIDIYNNLTECVNYISVMNAYTKYDEYFKASFKKTYEYAKATNSKLASAMYKYINADTSILGYASEVFDAIKKFRLISIYEVFDAIYMKVFLKEISNLCIDFAVNSGTTVGSMISSAVASTTVASIATGVSVGVTLGIGVSQFMTNSKEWQKSMAQVIAVGELSVFAKETMLNYENTLKASPCEENAALFDRSYGFYCNIQKYACTQTINALKAQSDSIAVRFQKDYESKYANAIEGVIQVLELHQRVQCHKTDLNCVNIIYDHSAIYTGKEHKPEVTIADKVLGQDYTVTYENNKNIGTAKIRINAIGNYTKGSVEKTFVITPQQPKSVSILQLSNDSLSLLISPVTESDGYKISICDAKTKKTISELNCKDNLPVINGLKKGLKYLIKVKAFKNVNKKPVYSREFSRTFQISDINTMTTLSARTSSNTAIKLFWNEVEGATGYRIYRYNDKTNKYDMIYDTTNLSYIDKSAKIGVKYKYVVKAYQKSGNKVVIAKQYKTVEYFVSPGKTSKLSLAQTEDSINATWKSVTGASGYKVTLYSEKNKALKMVYTTKTSYTFSKLSMSTTYKVKVTAYKTINGKKVDSSVYTLLTTATKPGTPTLSATAGAKKATLKWNKQTGATGYVVYMATSKNGKYTKIATVKGNGTVSFTKTGLTKGKTYYFKVVAYKTVGSTTLYGSYSSVKAVKAK